MRRTITSFTVMNVRLKKNKDTVPTQTLLCTMRVLPTKFTLDFELCIPQTSILDLLPKKMQEKVSISNRPKINLVPIIFPFMLRRSTKEELRTLFSEIIRLNSVRAFCLAVDLVWEKDRNPSPQYEEVIWVLSLMLP